MAAPPAGRGMQVSSAYFIHLLTVGTRAGPATTFDSQNPQIQHYEPHRVFSNVSFCLLKSLSCRLDGHNSLSAG